MDLHSPQTELMMKFFAEQLISLVGDKIEITDVIQKEKLQSLIYLLT